jgi:hypothetical protein
MTIRISFSDKTVRVAVEINGAIESAITELPQRTWVGLTPDELNMIGDSMKTWSSFSITDVYFAIEAKLRSKNT